MQPNPLQGERKHYTRKLYTRQCLCRSNAVPGTVTLTSLWSGKSKVGGKVMDYLYESDTEETVGSERLDSDCNYQETVGSERLDSDCNDKETAGSERLDSDCNDKETAGSDSLQDEEEKQQDRVIDTAGVIVRPKRTISAGSTAHYTYFHRTRSLSMFVSYLTSLDGGERSKTMARQYAADLSKYLYFASECAKVKWTAVADAQKIKSYLEQLTNDGIHTSGQINKLAAIRHGIQYCLLEGIGGESLKSNLSSRLKNWMRVMRKTRTGEQMRREEELSESPPDISSVGIIMSDTVNRIFEGLVQPATAGETLSVADEDTLVSFLLAVLMYGNAQRPAAVLNANIDDYRKRRTMTDEGETYVLIKVGVFQPMVSIIFTTGDQAQDVQNAWSSQSCSLSARHAEMLDKYVQYVRSPAPGETNLLLNTVGRNLENYDYHMKKVSSEHTTIILLSISWFTPDSQALTKTG